MRIGFVTCQADRLKGYFPTIAEPDFISPDPLFTPDDYIAAVDLRAHGHEVRAVVWGEPSSSLRDLDAIVVRSPWDYMDSEENKKRFFAWLAQLEEDQLPLMNSPALMRWLLDKHYLQYFANNGVQVIPTQYITAGSQLNLAQIFNEEGAHVLKQCISAGGAGMFFIDSLQTAKQQQPTFQQQLNCNDYMLQPLIPEIMTHGEWSLIFLGSVYSHCILKKPAAHSIMVHAERGGSLHFPVTPPATVLEFANNTNNQLTQLFTNVLYLRVDVIETANGCVLVECEGVEPELFFRAATHSEQQFRLAIENAMTA